MTWITNNQNYLHMITVQVWFLTEARRWNYMKLVRSVIYQSRPTFWFLCSVKVVRTADYQQLWDLPHAKVQCMKFSPKGTHLLLWENYSGK